MIIFGSFYTRKQDSRSGQIRTILPVPDLEIYLDPTAFAKNNDSYKNIA
jgi:hypothetical protein